MPTMAYVVRSRKRFEIRESFATPEGPRSRTLATFSTLDDTTLDGARSRARGSIDVAELRRSCRRLGAPVADSPIDAATKTVIGELAAGRRPTPALAALLRQALATVSSEVSDVGLGDLSLWVTANDTVRGQTLKDLLDVGDRFPPRDRGPLV